MNIKIIVIIELLLININNIICERCAKYTLDLYNKTTIGPFTNTGLKCGKERPNKQTDCTNYGTDSGMYCCWVAKDEYDTNGECRLISLAKIERNEIDGCAQFIGSYWSCGNYSNYIKNNRIIIIFVLLTFFLMIK